MHARIEETTPAGGVACLKERFANLQASMGLTKMHACTNARTSAVPTASDSTEGGGCAAAAAAAALLGPLAVK
eukprot:262267-Pelagomonas_calceolata.AAC.5